MREIVSSVGISNTDKKPQPHNDWPSIGHDALVGRRIALLQTRDKLIMEPIPGLRGLGRTTTGQPRKRATLTYRRFQSTGLGSTPCSSFADT